MDHVEASLARGIDLTVRLADFPVMEVCLPHNKDRNPIIKVEPMVDMY